jgi:hypothetical protein
MILIQLDNPGKCYTLDLDTTEVAPVPAADWYIVSSELHASTIIYVSEDAPAEAQGPQEVRLVVLLYDDEAGIATGYFLDHLTPRRYFSERPVPTLDLDDVTLKQTLHIGAQWAREMGCKHVLLYQPERRPNPLRLFEAADLLGELWAAETDVFQAEY